MKKILFIVAMGLCGSAYAAGGTSAKIQGVGQSNCVAVSSIAWTAIPSTTTIKSGRGGIMISAPSTNTAGFGIAFTSNTISVPTASTTSYGVQMAKGDYIDFSISQFVYAFAVSLHTDAENICYQEYTLEIGR